MYVPCPSALRKVLGFDLLKRSTCTCIPRIRGAYLHIVYENNNSTRSAPPACDFRE